MKVEDDYLVRSLEALENDKWPEGNFETRLVKRCHELRKIPLKDFSDEDIRLMIGQQIGLAYLVPIALEKLKENLWVAGGFFEGDLLKNTLGVNSIFWKEHTDLLSGFRKLLESNRAEMDERKISTAEFYKNNQLN